MIVLDTNVVSEGMKPEPNADVRRSLDAQATETLYISCVTIAELLFGVAVLPSGRRRQELASAVSGIFDLFEGRVIPFDTGAARRYADLALRARGAGRGFPAPDGYIAAIAASRGFVVATRDTSAFQVSDVPFIDPWNRGS